jgi:hypothetical protein
MEVMKRFIIIIAAIFSCNRLSAQVIERKAPIARQAVFQQNGELVIPQLIIGGEWTSTIKLTNRGATSIPRTNVYFFDNTGNRMTATFRASTGDVISDTGFSFELPAGTVLEATFIGDATVRFGHGLIDPAACPAGGPCTLYGEVALRNTNPTRPDFEAIFPLERPVDVQYLLFDHRAGWSTTLYIVNNSPASTVFLEFRNSFNQVIRTISLPFRAGEAQILVPHALAPETIGLHGTLIINGTNPSTTAFITATALRINPSNSFTPMRTFVPPR